MALLDLSAVTQALTKFIELSVENSPAWQPRARPTASPLPPDQVQSAGLSFYLYHLSENPHLRTPPPVDSASSHVRYSPMALDLYFQMTAVPGGSSSNELLESQLLMGCALKALHDGPVIDDTTVISGTEILKTVGLAGEENRIRITSQPVTSNDAVNYWTAGSQAMRLAAYYQVSVILLEPEEPDSRSQRVLSPSVDVFAIGGPRLSGSESYAVYTAPDGQTSEIKMSPAVAAYGEEITLLGSSLNGDGVRLKLRGGGDNAVRVAGDAWQVTAQAETLIAKICDSTEEGALVPGVYAVSVSVDKTLSGRDVSLASNEIPIQIRPSISAVTSAGGGVYDITGGLFKGGAGDTVQVEVYINLEGLSLADGAIDAGKYKVVDESTVRFKVPASITTGETVSVRVVVNGAESLPIYLEVA